MAALPSAALGSPSKVALHSRSSSLPPFSSSACSILPLSPNFPLDSSSLSTSSLFLLPLKHFKHRLFATTGDDEWGDEPSPPDESLKKTVTAAVEEISGIADLKTGLIDNLFGTDRGLNASSETRAEIVELITQLEAKNPTTAPTEALPLLNGKWILAYTSFSELFPLLAAGTLPLVKVGEISQFIDANALTVENSVSLTGPLATTSLSASASFEVRSPKRVQIKFEEGVIGTPQLIDSIEIPDDVDFLGQKIDLRGLRRVLQDTASSVARTISGQPPIKFPIRNDKAQSWLLTTYLDEELRISRGDGGSIFVLIKEGSPLLSQ